MPDLEIEKETKMSKKLEQLLSVFLRLLPVLELVDWLGQRFVHGEQLSSDRGQVLGRTSSMNRRFPRGVVEASFHVLVTVLDGQVAFDLFQIILKGQNTAVSGRCQRQTDHLCTGLTFEVVSGERNSEVSWHGIESAASDHENFLVSC